VTRKVAIGIALLLATGCGGEDKAPRPEPVLCRPILPVSDTPDPGSGPVDCGALDGYELFLIDDFELGRSRTGWYVNNDRTAEQSPAPDEDPPHTSQIPGGRCAGVSPSPNAPTLCDDPTTPRGECNGAVSAESRSAIHILSGLLTNNGGQLGRNLQKRCSDTVEACPFSPGPPEVGPCSIGMGPSPPRTGCSAANDMSGWDGIVFWGRVAPGSQASVRVRAADAATDDAGCICDPYTNQNDSSTGCDKWGSFVVLDPTFRAKFVPFSEMQQGGWGRKSPGLDLHDLFSLGIEYGRGAWDLWIDDIAFYRSRQ
jgi:hypothetical protein